MNRSLTLVLFVAGMILMALLVFQTVRNYQQFAVITANQQIIIRHQKELVALETDLKELLHRHPADR